MADAIAGPEAATCCNEQLNDLLIEFPIDRHHVEGQQEERDDPKQSVSHLVALADLEGLERSLVFLSRTLQSPVNMFFIDLFKQRIAGGADLANNLLESFYYFGCRKGSFCCCLFRSLLSRAPLLPVPGAGVPRRLWACQSQFLVLNAKARGIWPNVLEKVALQELSPLVSRPLARHTRDMPTPQIDPIAPWTTLRCPGVLSCL